MFTRLKTVVLRRISDDRSAMEFEDALGGPGAEAAGESSEVNPSVWIETLVASDGERGEIATEKDALGIGIAIPFKLIKPFTVETPDPGGNSWGISDIGADALDIGAGQGVKVAILDTGIADHPAFDGLNPIRVNFTDEADEDVDGHGTHCAGTIFGQDVDGRRIGIARGVREPLIGKVLGRGGGDSASIMEAIVWAQKSGARVVSMSLGMDFPGFRERLLRSGKQKLEATSIALQAYRENVRLFDQLSRMYSDLSMFAAPLLVAASGNESARPDYTIATAPPAEADDILSVAAIDRSHAIAKFSNTNPDCCAPGVDILSASHTGGLRRLSGTSMATPHVAGAAVLEAARLAAGGRFTARELREAVLALASPVPGLSRADVGRGKITVGN